jgi:hypothetical protein
MGVTTLTKKYHCYNDCSQAGCPGHEFKIEFHSVTDYVTIYDGKSKVIGFEPPELNCLIDLLKELAELRADAPVEFEKLAAMKG